MARHEICGVYSITSPSGGTYVGSSRNVEARWLGHLSRLRRGKHHSPALQAAYQKYGELGLTFAILQVGTQEDLYALEQQAFDRLQPKYNGCRIAGSMAGFKRSPESVALTAAFHRGRVFSESHRANMAAAHQGKKRAPHSESHKAAIAAANTGKRHSAEVKARISAATRGLKRKPFTDEHRANMAKARIGKKASPEARARMSAAHKRHPAISAQLRLPGF